jgi:branched-chain amino acid transport system substrate-binding protein
MLALALPVLAQSATAAKTEFVLGVALPFSGPGQSYGNWGRRGIELAVGEANKTLGAWKITPIFDDTQNTPRQTITALQKLISDGAKVVISQNTASILAALPIARSANVLLINTGASGAQLAGQQGLFNSIPLVPNEARRMAAYAVKNGLKKIAIAYGNDSFGRSARDLFREDLIKAGGTVPIEVAVDLAGTDFTSQMSQVVATKPDGVYLATYGSSAGFVIEQGRRQGFEGVYLSGSWCNIPEVIHTGAGAGKGSVITMLAVSPAASGIIEEYKARYHEEPGIYVWTNYQAVLLVADVLKGTKPSASIAPKVIEDTLLGLGKANGPFGEILINKDGTIEPPLKIGKLGTNGFE